MRPTLSAVAFFLVSLVAKGQSAPSSETRSTTSATEQAIVKEITPAELATMLASRKIFVYDCNEEDMFAEAHVPGAVLTVYDEVTAAKLPPDKNATLVFYCYSPECPAGGNAARTAVKLGFVDVYCMKAGITGWQDAGLPTKP